MRVAPSVVDPLEAIGVQRTFLQLYVFAVERVLVVDHDPDFCKFVELTLRASGVETISKSTAEAGLAALAMSDYSAVLTDLHLEGNSGIDLCERIVNEWEHIPVIVMTARGTLDTAVAAFRAGASDFVAKTGDPLALEIAIGRALKHRRSTSSVPPELGEAKYEEIVGASSAMKNVFALIDRAGPSEASVLVTGESGTGKELVAHALHQKSGRRNGPFIAMSCAAIPAPLLDSELFGHEKGAFTDAKTRRRGLLAEASGGTLFLDEIGDMPIEVQPKLLRALQERRFRPVGSNEEVPFDARILTATNVDLDAAVRQRVFREDLYFRINVVRIHVPPLRLRGGDVIYLAQHFLLRAAKQSGRDVRGMTMAAAELIAFHPWPGNVRQLANCIEHAVTMTRSTEIDVPDLPEAIRATPSKAPDAPLMPDELVSLEEMERAYVLRVLDTVSGNKTVAAKILGLDRKTLYRKLARYQV